jgi:NADPH2:quinone reductase
VQRYRPGDRVCALTNGGAYAEYVTAPEAQALPWPEGFDAARAAALPETYFTVWANLFGHGRLAAGETVLVHGGTSGIGVTAIQLAKAFGAKVITTTGSDAKCEAARKLGADHAVNYRTEDFLDTVKAATGGRGVDVILDMVGGDYIERNIRALADDGRLVYIGFQSGSKATIDFMRVMLKRLTITGSTLRIRTAEVKAHIARKVEAEILPMLAAGDIKVPIDSTFPLAKAADAHRRIEEGTHIGKIVLTV